MTSFSGPKFFLRKAEGWRHSPGLQFFQGSLIDGPWLVSSRQRRPVADDEGHRVLECPDVAGRDDVLEFAKVLGDIIELRDRRIDEFLRTPKESADGAQPRL